LRCMAEKQWKHALFTSVLLMVDYWNYESTTTKLMTLQTLQCVWILQHFSLYSIQHGLRWIKTVSIGITLNETYILCYEVHLCENLNLKNMKAWYKLEVIMSYQVPN
jgi:hypothetical protein